MTLALQDEGEKRIGQALGEREDRDRRDDADERRDRHGIVGRQGATVRKVEELIPRHPSR